MFVLTASTVAWPAHPASAQEPGAAVVPTDSLTGVLEARTMDAFVVRSEDHGRVRFEVAPDTLDSRTQLASDTAAGPVPHASVMDRRDILFVLRQLEESDERDRVHVHYVTVGEGEPRRIAIWLSVERARLPGG